MNDLYLSLAQTFGPLVQLLFAGGLLALVGWIIGGFAFLGECRLLRTQNRLVWAVPFPMLLAGLAYGGLRASGHLLYAADGWDPGGPWNYTWQNRGALVLFVCGCLLLGAVLAARRTKRSF